MSKSNPHVFDLPTAQYIMQILLEQAENSPIHALLLFSVLSFTHYEELLVFRTRFFLSSKSKEIRFSHENCFFKQSIDNSKFKDALLKEYMLNIGNSFTIPLPKVYLDRIFQLKIGIKLILLLMYKIIYVESVMILLSFNNSKSSSFNQ
jgi:hypothetical protein